MNVISITLIVALFCPPLRLAFVFLSISSPSAFFLHVPIFQILPTAFSPTWKLDEEDVTLGNLFVVKGQDNQSTEVHVSPPEVSMLSSADIEEEQKTLDAGCGLRCSSSSSSASDPSSPSFLSDTHLQASIKEAAHIVSEADSVLVVAGAGIGCDSGLPDYRSKSGFWNAYPPIAKLGISLEDMSKTKWFKNDPKTAWGFYSHRTHLYAKAEPHVGFKILLDICQQKGDDYFVFTSNIDSQFQKAGFHEDKIFESHGSLRYLQCLGMCSGSTVWRNEEKALDINLETFQVKNPDKIPRCSSCGNLARPNVSFFSDTYQTFDASRTTLAKQRLLAWLQQAENTNKSLAIIEVGCGTSLHSLRFETEELCRNFTSSSSSTSSIEKPSPQEASSSIRKKVGLQSSKNDPVTSFSSVNLVRINPSDCSVLDSTHRAKHVALPMKALDALKSIDSERKKIVLESEQA